MLRSPCPVYKHVCLCCAGIPMEEDEYEQDTSIKGRLLMLVNKIKGQAHRAEEPTEKEQAAPCEELTAFITYYVRDANDGVPAVSVNTFGCGF